MNRERVMSDNSSESLGLGGTVVVIQHATYPLAPSNRSLVIRSPGQLNQVVPDALMIPLAMVVGHELGNRAPTIHTSVRRSSMARRSVGKSFWTTAQTISKSMPK